MEKDRKMQAETTKIRNLNQQKRGRMAMESKRYKFASFAILSIFV